jgi:hypothetical protein
MKLPSILLLCILIQYTCLSQSSIQQVANTFIAALDEKQRTKALYTFTDDERYNWHYFPRSDRKGISLNELTDQQKKAAFSLLETCLSKAGYAKTLDIIQLEKVLHVLENQQNDDYRNAGKYFIILFDKPAQKGIWGWRFEGHHISFNFSADNNKLISGTPGFLGANPAIVQSGPQKGKQPLKEETELGFALLHSFTPEQLKAAISSSGVPNDIITFVSRKATIESKEGISYSAMTSAQKATFMNLIEVYILRYTKLFAEDMLKELKAAGLEHLRFTWAGAQKRGSEAYYYRIQGPTIIIEYDNSQNNANHIHTVVRDLNHDFGGDELLEHYRKSHQQR